MPRSGIDGQFTAMRAAESGPAEGLNFPKWVAVERNFTGRQPIDNVKSWVYIVAIINATTGHKMSNRTRAMQRCHSFYSIIDNDETCVYCGEYADTWDHFLPISAASIMQDLIEIKGGRVLVPCCRDCNHRAGASLFKTVGAKRRYIQERIIDKYYDLLTAPTWTPHQLTEMGPGLRVDILAKQALKSKILRRIKWQNKNNSQAAQIANVSLQLGNKRDSAQLNASKHSIIRNVSGYSKQRRKRICENCGKGILTGPSHKRFCTTECNQNFQYKKRRELITLGRELNKRAGEEIPPTIIDNQ